MSAIKPPSPVRLFLSSLPAWWLAQVMNPGFAAVAFMFVGMTLLQIIEWHMPSSVSTIKTTPEAINHDNPPQEDTA